MAERTRVAARRGGPIDAFVSLARGDRSPGIVVIGDLAAPDPRLALQCDRLADAGFSAAAPINLEDLGWGVEAFDEPSVDEWHEACCVLRDNLHDRIGGTDLTAGLFGLGWGSLVALILATDPDGGWAATATLDCPAEALAVLTKHHAELQCPTRLVYRHDSGGASITAARTFATATPGTRHDRAVIVSDGGAFRDDHVWDRILAFYDVALKFDTTFR